MKLPRVILADEHTILLEALRKLLETKCDVTGTATNGRALLLMARVQKPDLIILDVTMPTLNGLEAARQLKSYMPDVRIIFLTMHTGEDLFLAALELGAKGYILKDSAMLEIVAGVRAVAAGRPYLSSALTARLLQPAGDDRQAEWVGRLSPTELRIVQLIAFDKSSKEIGEELSIHYRTVENHRTNICRKLGIEGANALLRFALQNRHKL